jgi:hypothetical protein
MAPMSAASAGGKARAESIRQPDAQAKQLRPRGDPSLARRADVSCCSKREQTVFMRRDCEKES